MSYADDKVRHFFSNQGDLTQRLKIWSGQFSNSSEISSTSSSCASFRKIWWKLNDLCWWRKQAEVFSAIKGTLLLDLWSNLASFLTHPKFHPCPPYLQVSERSDLNWMSYADEKVKQRLFQQSRVCNCKIKDPIWPGFELIRGFIYVHLICKFQEYPIKTEQVMLMTESNRDFFSNQGELILRLMIRFGQFWAHPRFHPCSPYLQVSGRSNKNWTSYANDKYRGFFSNQGEVTQKLMIQSGQFSNSFEN